MKNEKILHRLYLKPLRNIVPSAMRSTDDLKYCMIITGITIDHIDNEETNDIVKVINNTVDGITEIQTFREISFNLGDVLRLLPISFSEFCMAFTYVTPYELDEEATKRAKDEFEQFMRMDDNSYHKYTFSKVGEDDWQCDSHSLVKESMLGTSSITFDRNKIIIYLYKKDYDRITHFELGKLYNIDAFYRFNRCKKIESEMKFVSDSDEDEAHIMITGQRLI